MLTHEGDELTECENRGGIEMARVLEPEDDDLQVRVGSDALYLGAKEFRRAEEEIALNVNDRNLGIGAGAFLAKFPQVAIF